MDLDNILEIIFLIKLDWVPKVGLVGSGGKLHNVAEDVDFVILEHLSYCCGLVKFSEMTLFCLI